MFSFGVELPLADDDESSLSGVAVPDKTGVPVVGRLLDIMPVRVLSKVTAGVEEDSVSSYDNIWLEAWR